MLGTHLGSFGLLAIFLRPQPGDGIVNCIYLLGVYDNYYSEVNLSVLLVPVSESKPWYKVFGKHGWNEARDYPQKIFV